MIGDRRRLRMRYCPTCETEYEDEVIRFCTKDGTPLVDAATPTFTDNMPSESVPEDDLGEETVIRRSKPAAPAVPELPDEIDQEEPAGARIVIDTTSEKKSPESSQPKAATYQAPPPRQIGVGVIVFFSVLGTLIVVIGIIGIVLLLTMRGGQDVNANANENVNENANVEENLNANDLLDLNTNVNVNANANAATPTPTPTPTPTETPEANVNTNVQGPNSNVNAQPPANTVITPPPPANVTPVPPPSAPPSNTNRPVNVGTINNRALSLPLPSYPSEAKQVNAMGRVAVSVVVDTTGHVVSATATAGHPLLRRSAENAAMRSRFRPFSVNGSPVPARGTIWYNFVD